MLLKRLCRRHTKSNALTLIGGGAFLVLRLKPCLGGGRQGLRFVTETVRGNGLDSMMRGCFVCGKALPTVVDILQWLKG